MEFKANLRFARVSCQKARLVADLVRGKKAEIASKTLRFLNKKSAKFISDLLNSALSNAENQKTVDLNNLYIKEILVNQGPSFKRFRPRAKGSASGYKKKTSHIQLTLGEKRV